MTLLLTILVFIGGCAAKLPVPTALALDEILMQTEGVTCADITYNDSEPPNCMKIYEAWHRGLVRVAKVYPEVVKIRMSAVTFYRPPLLYVPDKPYPLIANFPGNPRGVSFMSGSPMIEYSYEEVVEHEAVHVLTFLMDPVRVRDTSAIQADRGGYSEAETQFIPFYFYLIACHNTPDDPFGKGPLGKRDGCIQ